MQTYRAPISVMMEQLRSLGLADVWADEAMAEAVLEEAGKFATEVLLPLNRVGDVEGAQFDAATGDVTMPKGFKEAYQLFVDNGWNALPFAESIGGSGLPQMVSMCVAQMWSSANMAFGLCPLLSQGAVELLHLHGSEAQKATYLPKLVTGKWSGTMCLTESQAGSDLSVVRTRAAPKAGSDDVYLIEGQKIYITYGEHDLTENIIHMVLARLPDAPEGVKGISLFIVPKFLEDGTRNDVVCAGIEHKMGIHASPTCVMAFGEKGACEGYLVGEAHQGLKYMFAMMNNARLSVGVQGLGQAELASQMAQAYAAERVQGAKIGGDGSKVTIDQHADVKRMLAQMDRKVQWGRLLALYTASCMDKMRLDVPSEPGTATDWWGQVECLIPVVKTLGSEYGFWAASEAMQVFGGIGYIEETGIAQVLRDSRIAMIYEGSNGIQAQDLVLRKLLMEEGRCLDALLAGMEKLLEAGVCPDWWQARYEGWKATIKDIQAQARTAPEEAVVHGVGVIAAMG